VLTVFSFAGEVEQQLFALIQEWVTTEVARDAITLQLVMDERFIATFGVGKTISDNLVRLASGHSYLTQPKETEQ
jgi:hypothetical protein